MGTNLYHHIYSIIKRLCMNDIVYGPIADDGVTFQLRRHLSGAITIEELVKELHYAKGITFQYFFGTSLALSKLTKL